MNLILDARGRDTFVVPVTAQIDSITIQYGVLAQIVTLLFIQDAIGHSVSVGSGNLQGFSLVSSGSLQASAQSFICDLQSNTWVGLAGSGHGLVLSALYQQALNGNDENPLSQGGTWTEPMGDQPPLQILNHVCTGGVGSLDEEGNSYFISSLPPNNYVSVQIAKFSNVGSSDSSSLLSFALRVAYLTNNGQFYEMNVNRRSGKVDLNIYGQNTGGSQNFFKDIGLFPINAGDIWAFAVVGSTLYCLRNGAIVTSYVDTLNLAPAASGNTPALNGASEFILGDTGYINFEAGSAALVI